MGIWGNICKCAALLGTSTCPAVLHCMHWRASCLLHCWALGKDCPSYVVWLLLQIGQLGKGVSEQQAKQTVISAIDDFMKHKIEFAGKFPLFIQGPFVLRMWVCSCNEAGQFCALGACGNSTLPTGPLLHPLTL